MNTHSIQTTSLARIWIPLGAAVFLLALAVSAWAVPALRPLHVLQGLLYAAVVILAFRGSTWGLGAGFTVAVAWNSLNLFVTHLMQAGMVEMWSFLHTGHVQRPDTMMVPVGGVGHFVLLGACLAAAVQQPAGRSKWWKFAGGGALSIAYMALIIALALPS